MLAATWSLGRASPLPRRTWTCRDDSGAAFGRTRHGTEEGNRECARGTPRRYRDHRATGHASTLARTPALETSCLGGNSWPDCSGKKYSHVSVQLSSVIKGEFSKRMQMVTKPPGKAANRQKKNRAAIILCK